MAISQHRETRKLSGQTQFKPTESGLWKILIGAPFLATRQPQRRALFHLASQFRNNPKTTNNYKILSKFLLSNTYRHSSSSTSTHSSSKPGFLNWYLSKLQTNPIITKSVSASLIYTSADITSQMITMPEDGSFDLFRMVRMCSYALIVTGSGQHYWFGYLSKILPGKNVLSTLTKIFLGQALYAPFMNTVFFSYNAVLRGENQYEIVARLKRDLVPTLKNSIVYWPFCDFISFMFVPVHLQPLLTCSLAYLWIIYMSYMASLKKVEADERLEYAYSKRAPTNHTI